jgi:succinate dehydrogenase/fumarate reductase flavoprotein subunit
VDIPGDVPVILATGGFPASRELVGRYITPAAGSMMIRANRWSTGDGLRLGIEAGAETTSGLDEFYGRAMPAPPALVRDAGFVRLAQLYARFASVEARDGERFATRTWSEIDVVQWMARKPGARARFTVPVDYLDIRPRNLTIREMIAAAERAGGRVRRAPGTVSVDVVAGITSTLGGLQVGVDARVAPGVFAAGSDVGGVANGGYASGLAAALVLGVAAADSALVIS